MRAGLSPSPTASRAPGGSGRALFSLAQSQSELLTSLRDPLSGEAAMLTSIMVSNALLELSKLPSNRLSLVEFAEAALGSIAQCAPVESGAISFATTGLPSVRCALGNWPVASEDAALADGTSPACDRLRTAPLLGPGSTSVIGYLGIGGAPQSLLDAGLVERAADHVSVMLGMLVEAERLRRAAAASRALELIGALDDAYGEEALLELASALQMLPGAEATSLVVEIPRFAGPVCVEAGVIRAGSEPTVRYFEIDRRGAVTVSVWWAAEEPHDSRLGEICDRLASAISRAERTARLLEEVEIDALTGVGNRRRASRALAQVRARCSRDGEQFGVLMMDLDKFKLVNDRYGHSVGDDVLCAFARSIEKVVRSYDIAARWGGEEFVLVCPATGADGAQSIARRLLIETPEMCAAAFPDDHRQTVSIGIAIGRDASFDALDVLREADAALYEAKRGGRNRFAMATAGKR